MDNTNRFLSGRDHVFKFVIIGPESSGKTNLFYQLTESKKQEQENRQSTKRKRQKDRKTLIENINGFKIQVSVWDTTGDWENNSIRQNNIKDADRVLVVFDYENKNSLEKVAKVDLFNLSKIKRIKNAVLIGNKIQKETEDAVLDAIMVAEKYRIPVYFTSTNDEGLVKNMKHKILFQLIAEKQMKKIIQYAKETNSPKRPASFFGFFTGSVDKEKDKQKEEIYINVFRLFLEVYKDIEGAFSDQMSENLNNVLGELRKILFEEDSSNLINKRISIASNNLMEKIMHVMNEVRERLLRHRDDKIKAQLLVQQLQQQLAKKNTQIQHLQQTKQKYQEQTQSKISHLSSEINLLLNENKELKIRSSVSTINSEQIKKNQQQIGNLKYQLQKMKQQIQKMKQQIFDLEHRNQHIKMISPSSLLMKVPSDVSYEILRSIQQYREEKVQEVQLVYRIDLQGPKFRDYSKNMSSLLCGLRVQGTTIWVYSPQEFLSSEAQGLLFMHRGQTTRIQKIHHHKLWRKDLSNLFLGDKQIKIYPQKHLVRLQNIQPPLPNQNLHNFLQLPPKQSYKLDELQILHL